MNKWTTLEYFYLFHYPDKTAKELAKDLKRTKRSVQNKLSLLKITNTNNNKNKELTIEDFCNDCIENKKKCTKNIHNCLEEAIHYRKNYFIDQNQFIQKKKNLKISTIF